MGDAYPVLQIRSNCIISYYQTQDRFHLTAEQLLKRLENLAASRELTYSGTFSPQAKKRLTKAVDLLCQIGKRRRILNPVTGRQHWHTLSFLTLTIPDSENYTGRQVYDKAFVHFMQWLRRTQKVKTYIWKLEFQARGQAHYHITFAEFIHHRTIRDKWNAIMFQNGWLNEYYSKNGHYNPNSTDIHSVRKVKDLSGYLVKEFAKSIQNKETTGKLWDCSTDLKKSKFYTIDETNSHYHIIKSMEQQHKLSLLSLQQCTVIKMPSNRISEILSMAELLQYDEHLNNIRKINNKHHDNTQKQL